MNVLLDEEAASPGDVHLVQAIVDGRDTAADHFPEPLAAAAVFLPGRQHRHFAQRHAQGPALDQDLRLEAAVRGVELERNPAQHARRIQPIARVIVPKREPERAVLEAGGQRVGRQARQRHSGAQRLDAIQQPRCDHHALSFEERGVEQVGQGLGRMQPIATYLDHEVETLDQCVLEGGTARAAVARVAGVAVQPHREPGLPRQSFDVIGAEPGGGFGHHHHLLQPGRSGSWNPFERLAQPLAIPASEQEEPDRRELTSEFRAPPVDGPDESFVDPRPETSLRRVHTLRRTVKSA